MEVEQGGQQGGLFAENVSTEHLDKPTSSYIHMVMDRLHAAETAVQLLQEQNLALKEEVDKLISAVWLTPQSNYRRFSNGDLLVWRMGQDPMILPLAKQHDKYLFNPHRLPAEDLVPMQEAHRNAPLCAVGQGIHMSAGADWGAIQFHVVKDAKQASIAGVAARVNQEFNNGESHGEDWAYCGLRPVPERESEVFASLTQDSGVELMARQPVS